MHKRPYIFCICPKRTEHGSKKVLKRFLSYLVGMAIGGVLFLGIMKLADMYFGDPTYGLIAVIGLGFIWFTWTMSVSQVESEEREARWAKERTENRLT